METNDNGKVIAIVSHLFFLGWLVALVMNQSNKTEYGSFYIRQNLGLMLLGLTAVVPFVGWLVGLGVVVLWVMSLVNAIGDSTTPVPFVGEKIQELFKAF